MDDCAACRYACSVLLSHASYFGIRGRASSFDFGDVRFRLGNLVKTIPEHAFKGSNTRAYVDDMRA